MMRSRNDHILQEIGGKPLGLDDASKAAATKWDVDARGLRKQYDASNAYLYSFLTLQGRVRHALPWDKKIQSYVKPANQDAERHIRVWCMYDDTAKLANQNAEFCHVACPYQFLNFGYNSHVALEHGL